MTIQLRIILIVASFLTAALMLRRIRRSKVRIEDSVFWIVLSVIILIMSIFPQIADACASALHIYLTTNFLFLFFIFVLLVKLFTMSVTVSQLETKLDRLAQEQALAKKEQEEASRAAKTARENAARVAGKERGATCDTLEKTGETVGEAPEPPETPEGPEGSEIPEGSIPEAPEIGRATCEGKVVRDE